MIICILDGFAYSFNFKFASTPALPGSWSVWHFSFWFATHRLLTAAYPHNNTWTESEKHPEAPVWNHKPVDPSPKPKMTAQMGGVLASVAIFNQKHERIFFFPPSTTGFLTKCYRNICYTDTRNVKANNASTIKVFSYVCRILAFLLILFLSAQKSVKLERRQRTGGIAVARDTKERLRLEICKLLFWE